MMRNIWLLIQENSLPEYGSLNRHANFAKYLKIYGYNPVVFVASKARCSTYQMIAGEEEYLVDDSHGFPFVYLRVNDYGDDMKRRLLAIGQYHRRMASLASAFSSRYGKPDIILGSSNYPITPTLAIHLANKFDAKSICEIRDLWPLSLEEYGVIKPGGSIARVMYQLERLNYEKADAVVFTMPGGPEYVAKKGWDTCHGGKINPGKLHHINNGVDIPVFEKNKKKYSYDCEEFHIDDSRLVVYSGSVRRANHLLTLVEAADYLRYDSVRFIVFGEGSEIDFLRAEVNARQLSNIHFKGSIEKKYIPSALSKADIVTAISDPCGQGTLSPYGNSNNKLFEYLASGKPVLINSSSEYSIVNQFDCGVERNIQTSDEYAAAVKEMLSDQARLEVWGRNSLKAAECYSFSRLTEKMLEVFESIS